MKKYVMPFLMCLVCSVVGHWIGRHEKRTFGPAECYNSLYTFEGVGKDGRPTGELVKVRSMEDFEHFLERTPTPQRCKESDQ